MKEKWNAPLAIVLMAALALTRWPGLLPDNFSAVYALAFCAGVYFPGVFAWALPLGTLLVTDLLLNWHYGVSLISKEMLGNYAAFALVIWLGRRFTVRSPFLNLLGGGLLGAILFYLITNTASWLWDAAYTKTIAGWIQALTVGRPGFPHTWQFFINTLMSGGLFTGLFAGAMKLSEAAEPQEEAEEEPAEEPQEGDAEESKA